MTKLSQTADIPILSVKDLEVSYGEAGAIFGVNFEVAQGSVLAILGRNGSGKSSLAAAISGGITPKHGSVFFMGEDITKFSANKISKLGVAWIPEERALFPHLTVIENLRLRLRRAVPRNERASALERALDLFPILAERRRQAAGTLSGGEQQMLSLARVLAAPPRLLVADEMSNGLAPQMVDLVFDTLDQARKEGVTIILIEQYVERALGFAEEVVVLQRGLVSWEGKASAARSEVLAEYLGTE